MAWKLLFETGMRVLIADDQRGAAQTLADLVRRCQHEVVEIVESGLAAIEAYQRHQPDVVLMDYWMARLNGATAARNILAKDPTARIIFVSGNPPPVDLHASGALAVLTKPVKLDRLYAALHRAGDPQSLQTPHEAATL